jgi:hypothetical protein
MSEQVRVIVVNWNGEQFLFIGHQGGQFDSGIKSDQGS